MLNKIIAPLYQYVTFQIRQEVTKNFDSAPVE